MVSYDGDGDGKQITEKERLSAAAGKINFWWERKFEEKKCEKEWLPVHRLRECRHRSSGHDGAEYCDGMRPRSCQHGQSRTDSRSDRQADRQKERADGSVSRARKGWKDRQRVWWTETGRHWGAVKIALGGQTAGRLIEVNVTADQHILSQLIANIAHFELCFFSTRVDSRTAMCFRSRKRLNPANWLILSFQMGFITMSSALKLALTFITEACTMFS